MGQTARCQVLDGSQNFILGAEKKDDRTTFQIVGSIVVNSHGDWIIVVIEFSWLLIIRFGFQVN